MENRIGFRFRPTDEEMVDIYLRPKNLISNTSHVDEVINTLDICSFDPWELPSQSKIKSKDQVWYFFGQKENRYNRGDRQSRKTKSGFWKKTGVTMDIMRKKGDREKIGETMVLVFHFSKNGKGFGSKSGWVMHEYHATFSSPNDQMMRSTICKVKCKGEMKEISSASGSEIQNIHSSGGLGTGSENPIDFISCLNEHQEAQLQDAMRAFNMPSDDWKSMFNGDVQSKIVSMQENYSHYIPQKPLSGVFDDNSSDDDDGSDLLSATTKTIQTSSTCDSFASSNHSVDQNKTPQCPDSLPQEVGNQGTEIGEHRLGQEMIQKKKAGFCHRMIRKLKKVKLCSSIDLKYIISINEKKTLLYFPHL